VRKYTQQQSDEMYAILTEIHDALGDLRNNTEGKFIINLYEKGWFNGIDRFLKKINKPVK